MHVASGANAFDDLLAEVAALGEVEGLGLAGLLREVAIADVRTVLKCAGEKAKPVEGLGGA